MTALCPLQRLAAGLAAAALLFASADAGAQRMPGRGGGGEMRGNPRGGERESPRAAPAASQGLFAALERELPSLKVDLLLAAAQVETWAKFERIVRDLAEGERLQRRHQASLRDGGESSGADRFLAQVEEDDRLRADGSAALRRTYADLSKQLDPAQQRMLERRIVQSQVEPMGQDIAAPRRSRE